MPLHRPNLKEVILTVVELAARILNCHQHLEVAVGTVLEEPLACVRECRCERTQLMPLHR